MPHPWKAFWDAGSKRYYFGSPQTGKVQWDVPVAPPPPPRPAYTEASYERLVAELSAVNCFPSQHSMRILYRQEVTVKDLCDLSSKDLHDMGIHARDAHKIWTKIDMLQNRILYKSFN